jgi:predicted nucleic acid-binding protein
MILLDTNVLSAVMAAVPDETVADGWTSSHGIRYG